MYACESPFNSAISASAPVDAFAATESRAETLVAFPLLARPAVFFPLPFVGTVTGCSRLAAAPPSGVMAMVLLRGISTRAIITISVVLDSGGTVREEVRIAIL
jgi:hypothetical protein